MANRERGEVSLSIGGRVYTLYLDTNALALLEDLFSTPERDMTFLEILERVQRNSVRHMRGMIWAALQHHHPDVSVQRAGELINDAGGLGALAEQLQALSKSTQPDAEDLDALGHTQASSRPTKAVGRIRGTGANSTLPHVATA